MENIALFISTSPPYYFYISLILFLSTVQCTKTVQSHGLILKR